VELKRYTEFVLSVILVMIGIGKNASRAVGDIWAASTRKMPSGELSVEGYKLSVKAGVAQLANSGHVGAHVWPATEVLTEFMVESQSLIKGGSVIELGAGMGLVGMAAAVLGARKVVLTDHRPRDVVFGTDGEPGLSEPSNILLHALRSNIDDNATAPSESSDSDMVVAELEFGKAVHVKQLLADHGEFDIIIGSDVTYYQALHEDLMQTLLMLGSPRGSKPVPIFLAHQRRSPGGMDALQEAMTKANLQWGNVYESSGVVVIRAVVQ
jgi:predicted nicotinamide N-methyase